MRQNHNNENKCIQWAMFVRTECSFPNNGMQEYWMQRDALIYYISDAWAQCTASLSCLLLVNMIEHGTFKLAHLNTTTKLCDCKKTSVFCSLDPRKLFETLRSSFCCIKKVFVSVCFNATNTDFKTGFWFFIIISFSFISGFCICFKSKEKKGINRYYLA